MKMDVKYFEKRLTSAQVKTLVATDVTLVAAPGAGKAIVPLWATLTLDYGTITYTWANTDHNITVGPLTMTDDAAAQAVIEATADFTAVLRQGAVSAALTENAALVVGASGTGEPAAGDGTLIVRGAYIVVDTDTEYHV